MIDDPVQLLAPLVALLVTYVLFYEGLIHTIGSDSGFWRRIRSVLPWLDEEARDLGFYTSYTVKPEEHVGNLLMDIDEARSLFIDDFEFIKAPLAAHKEDWEGRREIASLGLYDEYTRTDIESWNRMKRFLMMAFVVRKQLHVTLFWDADTEQVVVTAHWEWSPYNVFKAFEHFRGEDYNVEKGVQMTGYKLRNVKRFEVADGVDTSNPNAEFSPALF